MISADGVPACRVMTGAASTQQLQWQQSVPTLQLEALQTLIHWLSDVRPAKSTSDLQRVVPLADASWATFNMSCGYDVKTSPVGISYSDMHTLGACAELGLQLAALSRDAHQYSAAVVAAKRSIALSESAALAETDSWRHGERFAAVRMRAKAALARAHVNAFQHDLSLETITDIMKGLPTDTPPAAVSVLLELHSEILTCRGEDNAALLVFERAVWLTHVHHLNQPRAFGVRHVELLNHVLASTSTHSFQNDEESKSATLAPPAVIQSLREKRDKIAAGLVQAGRWRRPDQLPRHMTPSLHDYGPFPSWNDVLPQRTGEAIRVLLQRKTDVLEQEAWQVHKDGLMDRDRECLHGATGGRWWRFSPTGFWHNSGLDENGCASLAAPIACACLKEIREIMASDPDCSNNGGHLKLSVLRVGYSIVEKQTWIRPHFGRSNAQFKMHLGLTIPSDSNNNGVNKKKFCPPSIRVGRVAVDGEIRKWSRGKVMLFDDSFEHEVKNDCDSARAVFQVVFSRSDNGIASSSFMEDL